MIMTLYILYYSSPSKDPGTLSGVKQVSNPGADLGILGGGGGFWAGILQGGGGRV